MAHLKRNNDIQIPKPSKEELEKSIKEIGYRNTDRKYGRCDNTARRWAMAYGIILEEKCVLKSRARLETVMVNGKLVYKKDQNKSTRRPTKEKKVELTEVSHKPNNNIVDLSKSKNRYSEAELSEFKTVVEGKILEGYESILSLRENLSRVADNGTDDTAMSGNAFEEGTASIERENMTELVAKKQRHLNALKGAMVRIGNGTYGICVSTGNLIPKERLLAVPHTTKCAEAKADSDNGKVINTEPIEKEVITRKPNSLL